MAATAPAVVFPEPGRVEVVETPTAEPGPLEIGIRTTYSGVSQGTERWVFGGRYVEYLDHSASYPLSPGYQAAGVVEAIGSDVTDVQPGDRVVVDRTRFGDPALEHRGPARGTHAGYLVVPRAEATLVPEGVDLAAASLFRMASVSRHGVRLAGVQAGQLVVVMGQGMIGQMSAQAARRQGARVIATDLIGLRVEASRAHSADRVVDASAEELEDVLREEAPGGPDVVIDTTGVSSMFARCVDLVRYEGHICLQGYYADPIEVEFHRTHLKRPTVSFPCGWEAERDEELVADLADGRLALAPLITHRIPYRDAEQAYELVSQHPDASLGMVLTWTDEAGA